MILNELACNGIINGVDRARILNRGSLNNVDWINVVNTVSVQ